MGGGAGGRWGVRWHWEGQSFFPASGHNLSLRIFQIFRRFEALFETSASSSEPQNLFTAAMEHLKPLKHWQIVANIANMCKHCKHRSQRGFRTGCESSSNEFEAFGFAKRPLKLSWPPLELQKPSTFLNVALGRKILDESQTSSGQLFCQNKRFLKWFVFSWCVFFLLSV